jgi:hypothetical protein
MGRADIEPVQLVGNAPQCPFLPLLLLIAASRRLIAAAASASGMR